MKVACDSELNAPSDPAQNAANPSLLPNRLPETPAPQENGNLIGGSAAGVAAFCDAKHGAQTEGPSSLTSSDMLAATDQEPSSNAEISCHKPPQTGNQQATDPLEELLY